MIAYLISFLTKYTYQLMQKIREIFFLVRYISDTSLEFYSQEIHCNITGHQFLLSYHNKSYIVHLITAVPCFLLDSD